MGRQLPHTACLKAIGGAWLAALLLGLVSWQLASRAQQQHECAQADTVTNVTPTHLPAPKPTDVLAYACQPACDALYVNLSLGARACCVRHDQPPAPVWFRFHTRLAYYRRRVRAVRWTDHVVHTEQLCWHYQRPRVGCAAEPAHRFTCWTLDDTYSVHQSAWTYNARSSRYFAILCAVLGGVGAVVYCVMHCWEKDVDHQIEGEPPTQAML